MWHQRTIILGTKNEQLTLLPLFHEVPTSTAIKPEKWVGLEHSIYKIYAGKSKDTLDNVGDYSLKAKEVTSMFGHFIKYRVIAANMQKEV